VTEIRRGIKFFLTALSRMVIMRTLIRFVTIRSARVLARNRAMARGGRGCWDKTALWQRGGNA